MTVLDVVALFMMPVGGLLVGGIVYWIATRSPRSEHPAE